MPTYFGYVERDEDNFINWAEIGKTMSDTLQNVNRVREEKKALIDKASRDYAKELANHPVGQDDNANAGVIEHADNASKFMLMQDRLLKQGVIKLKDYTTARQNLMDDTDNFFATMKAYNEVYAKKMERAANNESSSFEPWSMAFVEKFGDFNKAGAYINPMTGNVMMAMKREEVGDDGKKVYTMDNNPSETASVGVLKRIVDMTVDRYKMNEETTAIAETIGVHIESMIKNGAVTSTEDPRARDYQGQSPVLASKAATGSALLELTDDEKKGITFTETTADAKGVETKTSLALAGNETKLADKYHEAINTNPNDRTAEQKDVINKVNTVLAQKIQATKGISYKYEDAETNLINANITENPYRRMSVLTDNKITADNGKKYYYERDSEIAAKRPEAILVVSENGKLVPKLTEKQEKEVVEFVRSGVRAKLKYEEKQFAFKQDATDSKRKETRNIDKWEYDIIAEGKDAQDWGNEAAKLYAGDDNEAMTAIEYFEGSSNIKSITRTNEGITVYFTDKEGEKRKETISFFNPDGTERGVDSFVRSISQTVLGDDSNADQAVAGSKKYMGKALNRNLTREGSLPFMEAGEKVISMLSEDIFRKGQKEAAKLLEQQLSGLGLEIETAGTAENWVKIKAPSTTKSIKVQTNWYDDRNNKFDGDWAKKRKENYDALLKYLRKNLTAYTSEEEEKFEELLNKNWKSRTPKKTPAKPPAKPAKPAANAAPKPK